MKMGLDSTLLCIAQNVMQQKAASFSLLKIDISQGITTKSVNQILTSAENWALAVYEQRCHLRHMSMNRGT
jgi:hypothetical protein